MNKPRLISEPNAMRAWVQAEQREGRRVGVVPTMGALHAGHLSLVHAAREECDRVVATIFVNPTQFAPHEDLSRYPRPFERDERLLAEANTDVIFAPVNEVIYPPGFSTYVQPAELALAWEGEVRPTHFRGVATIVLKLFQMIPADLAFFGQKDFQQTRVIQRMVEDFNLATRIVVCPIVREPDGLAMSSRNIYLSPNDRQRALALSRACGAARRLFDSGERRVERLEHAMQQELTEGRVDHLDYAAIVDSESLKPISVIDRSAVALVAARIGSTRLIDNELFLL
jgi:pantoate--beta-alanine ligase